MRRSKWTAVWPMVLALLLSGCAAGVPAKQHTVTVIAKSTQTEFWLSVFAGAKAAATEYNAELNILGPETEEDYETQNQMIADAVEAGTEAIVFSAIDFEKNAAAIDDAARAGVKIVAIDSSVDSELVSTYIGQMAAQAALDRVDGPLKVGVVNYDVGTANGQERERGALDAFRDSGRAEITAVVNTLTEAAQARTDTAAMLNGSPDINVLLAFNEPTSVGAAQAVEDLGCAEDVFLVGFDSNVVTIDGLQEGTVDALVVQNPYAMGYLGVESACRLLTGQTNDMEPTVDTSTKIVDRDNLFEIGSQKALFAFEREQN